MANDRKSNPKSNTGRDYNETLLVRALFLLCAFTFPLRETARSVIEFVADSRRAKMIRSQCSADRFQTQYELKFRRLVRRANA